VTQNIYNDLYADLKDERFIELLKTPDIQIETILSAGHTTPADEWYDQEKDEWVLLIRGAARISIAGDSAEIQLNPGDHLHIPSHTKHRVTWTSKTEPTLWLAVHFKNRQT